MANGVLDRGLGANVALITAAAGGLGRVIASTFHNAGCEVFACDIDQRGLDSLAEELPGIHVMCCDAGSAESIRHVCDSARERLRAPVSVLVNNVGIAGPTAAAEDVELVDWDNVIRTNLTSHFLFAKSVIPGMRAAGRGLIVNISSCSAKVGLPLRLPYVVSKGAVLSMTQNLARELGPYGIRVNAILPGPIRGARIQKVIAEKAQALGVSEQSYEESLVRYTSMRTLTEPEDIAATIAFLASNGGERISGQLIGVDGNIEWEE